MSNHKNDVNKPSTLNNPNNPNKMMGFFDHIEELRVHLMRCLWVFMGGFILFYFWSEPLMAFLRKPLFNVLPPEQQKLYFTSLFENFLTHLKIAGIASVFFLSPYYFYEIWKFFSPGLKENEKKWVIPFVSAASFFFIAGAAFAYLVLFPVGFKYFVTYGGPADVPLLTIDSYYTTCLKLMLLFGLGFELPVIVVFLGVVGLVDSRFLRENRRNAILIITVLSALFAPPDALSMIILGVPLVLLYECAIYTVGWIEKKRPHTSDTSTALQVSEVSKHPWQGQSE